MNDPQSPDPTVRSVNPVATENSDAKIDQLFATIQAEITKYHTADQVALQYDFAKLIYFLHRLRILKDGKSVSGVIGVITVALKSIEHNPEALAQVRDLRRYAELEIRSLESPKRSSITNRFYIFLYESSTATKVITGLLGSLVLTLGLAFALPPVLSSRYATSSTTNTTAPKTTPASSDTRPQLTTPSPVPSGSDSRSEKQQFADLILLVTIAGFSGAAGGMVSIFSRIKEFENSSYSDSFLPFIVGATKPLISGSFGIFVYALVASQAYGPGFSGNVSIEHRICSIAALAFIAGFSERLVPDIIASAEKQNQQINPGPSEVRGGATLDAKPADPVSTALPAAPASTTEAKNP